MKTSELEKTIIEAERFLERAKDLLKKQKEKGDSPFIYRSIGIASVKRSSMDLTRQLSKLRKRDDD